MDTINNIVPYLITLMASLIQGISGFGFALVATPLLSLYFDLNFIVPVIVLYCIITNISIIIETYRHIKILDILLLAIFGLIGIPFGVRLLTIIDSKLLQLITGLIIIISSLIFLTGFKLNLKNIKLSQIIAGFISGILNGSLSMSGPPIAILMNNDGREKNSFRANMIFYSIITNIFTIYSMNSNKLFKNSNLNEFLINSPIVIIGVLIGQKISSKIDQRTFNKIVWIMLLVSGSWAFIIAIFKFI